MSNQNQVAVIKSPVVTELSKRLCVDEAHLQSIVMCTIMPTGSDAPVITEEMYLSFLAVASEYQLNPLTKEIYAFPAKGGGIQAIVSIDGWLKIINSRAQFDGMTFHDQFDDKGALLAVTCKIHRKDRSYPTEVTEYMSECKRGTDTWTKWPARMLLHKATIQAARYAFGLSGIIDPDEAERFEQAGAIATSTPAEKDISPVKDTAPESVEYYPDADFDKNLAAWTAAVMAGKRDYDSLVSMIESKAPLTDEQKARLKQICPVDIEGEVA